MNASLVEKLADAYVVEFSWEPAGLSFAEVIEQAGDIPLPPYIKRSTDMDDTERYQTIYAKDEGSVAAPTAGLHFTQSIFEQLSQKNIQTGFVTLHVGAGTFRPVKAATMQGHDMHAEWIDVHINTIELLCRNISNTIAAVGTTSLRTLESLYWMGLKVLLDPGLQNLTLAQWEVYEAPLANTNTSTTEALEALMHWLKKNKMERLFTQTRILIAPGYQFRVVNALVTNFHQPQSTLLLLVAAAVGNDWKKIYDHALQHNYRFLSMVTAVYSSLNKYYWKAYRSGFPFRELGGWSRFYRHYRTHRYITVQVFHFSVLGRYAAIGPVIIVIYRPFFLGPGGMNGDTAADLRAFGDQPLCFSFIEFLVAFIIGVIQ
jgi:S-adenosylmethionine:tRNA ribosyltransferase-isomerase